MKKRTLAFVNELLANPKLSNTEAYLLTHGTTNRRSAAVSASKLLTNPKVIIYMNKHADIATQRIVSLVDNASKEEVRLRAAQNILDRTYGKATQRLDTAPNVTAIKIDLTGSPPPS